MRSLLGQVQERASAPSEAGLPAAPPTSKEIPYDYVARFILKGVRGNRVQDVVNISVEGAFVAVTVGYSFIPAPLPNLCRPPMTELLTSSTASSTAAAAANCRTSQFTTSRDWESRTVNVRFARSPNPCCSCPARPFES